MHHLSFRPLIVLNIFPNNGKLYKYRSLQGESFENIYDCLEKGYMWIGKASALNDDFDSNFFGNPVALHQIDDTPDHRLLLGIGVTQRIAVDVDM